MLDARVDVPLVTAGGIGLLVALGLQSHLAPTACRWCDTSPGGVSALNGLDATMRSALRWDNTATANTASHVFAFGLAPAAALGLGALAAAHDDRMGGWGRDVFVIAESTLIAADLNQAVKFAVGRQRPAIHFAGTPAAPTSEDNLSFFSGDTTVAFSLAVSSGTVASMRGYRLAPLVWATGLTLAATAGYLRIAADRHYFTDVLTGAAVGSLVGFGVPYFLHRAGPAVAVDTQHGGILSWSGRF